MRRALVIVLAALVVAGCGGTSDTTLRLTLAALATRAPAAKPTPPEGHCYMPRVTASLRPPATMPAAGAMPAGSFMSQIQYRGYLIAGVNAGYLDFGNFNPRTGKIEGFEIDLVRELARAIFGDPTKFKLIALTAGQRFKVVQNRTVDVVVDVVTINCARRKLVDFSSVYYDAKQRVLVPLNSPAHSLADLGGKRVCATANTAPLDKIAHYPSHPIPVGRPQGADCLVALQEGVVSAISTDDSILLGFTKQDPWTKLVGPVLADAPYGMAINQKNPDFVRFVNGVLAQLRADGTWQKLYSKWLGGKAPAPPAASYSG
jgi:polar amino acid transport system substrate-binding protein